MLAVSTTLTALLGLALRIGLLGGRPVGAMDNGDAYRMFCTAGLTPDTPDTFALWHGSVVIRYLTGGHPCVAAPSSGATLLGLTVGSGPGVWSLLSLAWLYVGLTALATGLAAWAASAVALRRAAVVALPLVPLLAVPWWSRFDVSLYAEPAGLLGTVGVLLGLLVVAVTRPEHRGSRAVALGLLALGALVAATAKPGYLPVGALGAVACAAVVLRGRGWRWTGPATALLVLALGALPVAQSLQGQTDAYARVNTHNLVYTAVLPALGPDATADLGLPRAAADRAGEGYYWAGGYGIPGWERAIGSDPLAARARADRLLATHPGTVATMVGRGLTATMRPQLDYLPSAPWGSVPVRDDQRTVYPETGVFTRLLVPYLDAVPFGWLPGVLAVAALLSGLATLPVRGTSTVRRLGARRRGRRGATEDDRPRGLAVTLTRVAAVSAATALGLVGVAVLGDGYYELTKHVWLASYLLAETGLLGLAALGVIATRRYLRPGA